MSKVYSPSVVLIGGWCWVWRPIGGFSVDRTVTGKKITLTRLLVTGGC